MKLCTKCGETKPKTEFSFIQKRQQYFPWCMECKRLDLQRWREVNPRPLPEVPAVYRITNTVNGKVYIGVTHRPFGLRKAEHVRYSKTGSRFPVHAAMRKYGVESFTFEVIERVATIVALAEAERRHVQAHQCMVPNGYNRTEGGGGMCGFTHTDEARHAHSVQHTGYRHTPEAIEKIRIAGLGRKIPREAVERQIAKRRGVKRTAEQRARIAAGRKANPPRPNKGNAKYPAVLILSAIERVRAGERQSVVAKEVGIHQAYLSQLINGKRGATLHGGVR